MTGKKNQLNYISFSRFYIKICRKLCCVSSPEPVSRKNLGYSEDVALKIHKCVFKGWTLVT